MIRKQVHAATGFDVRIYGSGTEFVRAPVSDRPGCILLDYSATGLNGLEVQRVISSRPDPLPLIFLSRRENVPVAVQAMKAGAVDFLIKPVKTELLIPAILNAIADYVRRQFEREQLQEWRARYEALSPREIQVLNGLVEGKKNSLIAEQIRISLRTTKAHRASLLKKMGTVSLAGLVRIYDELKRHSRF
jgi:FixJ family two-component response regulator